MHFANNACSFGLVFIDGCTADGKWIEGRTCFSDHYVKLVTSQYSVYILNRLVNDSPSNRSVYKGYIRYNPYTAASKKECITLNDDELFYNGGDNDENFQEANQDEIKALSAILKLKLHDVAELKGFLNAINLISRHYCDRNDFFYETFQKSLIYETVFHHSASLTYGNATATYLMQALNDRYFGFSVSHFPHLLNAYRKNHTLAIVPRGQGKTTIQLAIIAAAVAELKNVRVVYSAHLKSMADNFKANVESRVIFLRPDAKVEKPGNRLYVTKVVDERKELTDLTCISVGNSDSGARGLDPTLVYEDEGLKTTNLAQNAMLAYTQRKSCKFFFLSSPMGSKEEALLKIISKVPGSNDITLYRIPYFCFHSIHTVHSTTQVACPQYTLFKPDHIKFSDDTKKLTHILCNGGNELFEQETGVIKRSSILSVLDSQEDDSSTSMFLTSFYDVMRKRQTFVNLSSWLRRKNIKELNCWIYVDTCYNIGLQSGIGFCCCVRPKKENSDTPVVVYMSQIPVMTQDTLSRIPDIIVGLFHECANHLNALKPTNTKLNFFVAIENNSNHFIVELILTHLRQSIYGKPYRVYVYNQIKKSNTIPGYYLDSKKTGIFSKIISACNKGKIKFSDNLGGKFTVNSNIATVGKTVDTAYVIKTFLDITKKFKLTRTKSGKRTWSGKITKNDSDDIVVAFVMAYYLSQITTKVGGMENWKPLNGVPRGNQLD